jgi:CHAT domain
MPMGKIVVLSFLTGDCQEGFQQVRLEIQDDNQRLLGAFIGQLPPAPHIPDLYTRWQSRYRQMGSRFRQLQKKPGVITNFSTRDLEADSNTLKKEFNDWLKLPGFSPVMHGLLMNVRTDEEVRVIIQTEDSHLRRLPWHLWEFFYYHLKAEVALSSTVYQQQNSLKKRQGVRILAIIGDSTGINLERDQRELEEKLPEAEIVFVKEPEKKEVFDAIWDWRGWDILFFAGHSISEPDATTGKLFIKDGKSLEITDLKLTFRRAIERGLKLAIFNSCDGLGIAKQLADLNMPQTIVMREPVPDMVAQEFLKYFLEAFARGESLYLAVREARERLETVQREFPCATWLPVICQNPAEEPVSWQELVGVKLSRGEEDCQQAEINDHTDSQEVLPKIVGSGLNLLQNAAKVWLGVKLVDAIFNVAKGAVNPNTEGEKNDESTTE